MSGAQFDDPNREAVGVEPIWTAEAEPPPEDEPEDDEGD
jgi:hypothetical protein